MSRSAEHDARNSAIRQQFKSGAEARAADVPTRIVIPAQCKTLGIPLHTEDVPDGAGGRLHWIGDREAKKVILHFHGIISQFACNRIA